MRRRQLVATAAAGALTAALTTLTVSVATLLGPVTAAPPPGQPNLALAAGQPTVVGAWKPRAMPLVIGHRGASAYRPEHTLDAYRMAVTQGADYIETDLVVTRDHQLVARHEHELSLTTDVADHLEFAGRRTTRTVYGVTNTGWFTEDFTVAELRTLRAKTRRTPGSRPSGSTGQVAVVTPPGSTGAVQSPAAAPPTVPVNQSIVTLQEIIDLIREQSRLTGRQVGLYVELKIPGYFASLGLAVEPLFVSVLRGNGLDRRTSPVFVESFEPDSLRKLHRLVAVPLIQVIWDGGGSPAVPPSAVPPSAVPATSGPGTTGPGTTGVAAGGVATAGPVLAGYAPAGLNTIREYAAGIAINREALLRRVPRADAPQRTGAAADLVRLAHEHGLEVHVYTFGDDRVTRPIEPGAYRVGDPPATADAIAEYRAYYRLGVDGVFTDNPDTAVRARR